MNYEAFRAMYEGREAKMFHPATGVLTWMSNPAQPSFVWQLYSWDLEPNSALFATQKACEPIHIQMNQSDWHVMVINNTPQKLVGITARVSVYNLDGALKYTRMDRLTAAPSAATDDGAVPFPEGLSAVHFVKLELRDVQHRLLSDNFYWHETQQDDFRALNTLPMVPLTASIIRRDAGGKCFLTVVLRNTSHSPALMAHLQLRNSRTDQRVLPVFYSDNYVSLLPGASKTIAVEATLAALGGDAPLIRVDGWNVTVKAAVSIAPNSNANVIDTPVPTAPTAPLSDAIRINCGGSGGSGSFFTFGSALDQTPTRDFVGDTDISGGYLSAVCDMIDTSMPNAAPQFVYQSERYGEFRYTIPVQVGRIYTVRLHFAETTFDRAGARMFNVAVNGKPVLTDFDIFAAASGKDKAVVKDFAGIMPDAKGNIIIVFTQGSTDLPEIRSLEVLTYSAQ